MTTGRRRALWGFIVAFLVGTCLIFVGVVLQAGWDAWRHPIRSGSKGADRDVTWLEQTSWSFGPGIVVSGFGGTLAGIAVVILRRRKRVEEKGWKSNY